MIEIAEARRLVAQRVQRMPEVLVPLAESLGLVLSQAVSADVAVPPDDCSAMDGFAVLCEDFPEGHATLQVTQEIMAGQLPTGTLRRGQAARIMTGAPIPPGADAVVMVEDTEESEPGRIVITANPHPGKHIRRAGEDLRPGAQVLGAGTHIGPAEIGLLASVGCAAVPVWRRPVIAVLATGDEVVAVTTVPGRGEVRNSNGPALCAAIREAGGLPLDLGIARDELAHTEELVREGISVADCLVTSAGVSVGDKDYVGEALDAAGLERVFWRVRQKPGKPLLFGVAQGKTVFGLPGYPVSSMVVFEQYVRPSIRQMLGLAGSGRRTLRARASREVRGAADRPMWMRVALQRDAGDGSWCFELAGAQSSGVLSTMARTDGLVELAEGAILAAGQEAEVRVIREPQL